MSRPRRPIGPPYSDEDVAEELIAEGTINLTPADVELAEYIGGRLPESDQRQVEKRLEEDEPYRTWAAPLLALREARLRGVDDISTNDVLRLERAIARGPRASATQPRAHFGPPYSEAELAAEHIEYGPGEVTPELEELAAYVAGGLPGDQRDALERRCASDAAYRTWAAPLLALQRQRPRAVHQVKPGDVQHLEQAVADRLASPARSPNPRPRRHKAWTAVRFVVLAAVGLWVGDSVLALVEEAVPAMAPPSDPRSLINLTPRDGARFTWAPTLDPDGVPRLQVVGAGLIRVDLGQNMLRFSDFSRTRLRIETSTDLVEVAYGVVRATTAPDSTTRLELFFPGSATIRRRTDPPSAARDMEVHSAELLKRMLTP